jgi:5,10-methylenetetrahydromethanopterin reductase
MKAGVLVFPDEEFLNVARAAERGGFDFLGVTDSQSLAQELYTSLGAAARETERIALGPTVTNPVTRHPVVTASAMCTLDSLSGGRARIGVGSGDSAGHTLGKRPARIAERRAFVELFEALCRGERAEHDGEEVGLTWVRKRDEQPEIPVYLTAEGPKSFRMAGAVADHVLVGTGIAPEVLNEATRRIEAGAREAGRGPDDIEVWAMARAAVADDVGALREDLLTTVASVAHHTLAHTFEGKAVPTEHEDALRELVAEYDPEEHEGLGEDPMKNARLVERLGLGDYLIERLCIAGTPAECVTEIERLEGVVDGVHFNPVHDTGEFVARMAADVLPHLSDTE